MDNVGIYCTAGQATDGNILYSRTGHRWQYIVQPDRPQMAIWRMRFACRIPKATDTHSEYVIPIVYRNNGNAKELQYYVIPKYPVLLTAGV
jgi:hypothetical protein